MSVTSARHAITAVDVWLLRTALRRVGGDAARAAALVLATWATIACATSGVLLGVGMRVGVAAGVPQELARLGVVAAVAVVCGAGLVRLACGSGLAARLASPDELRAALGVPSGTGAWLGVAVHGWMVVAATLPLALAWLAADAEPLVALACAAMVATSVVGAAVLARCASGSGARRPRAGAVLGSTQRVEIVALAVAVAVGVAGLLPAADALRAAMADAAQAAASHGVAAAATAAGLAAVAASDRLLAPDVALRIRRGVALVDAGAPPRLAVLALAREPVLVWMAIATASAAALAAWGAPSDVAIGMGGAVAAVGIGAEALAVRLVAPARRILAAALLVAAAALAPPASAPVLALATTVALLLVLRWRLRCPSS